MSPLAPWELDRLTAVHVMLDEAMCIIGYPNNMTRRMLKLNRKIWRLCIEEEGCVAQAARILDILARLDAAFPIPSEEEPTA